MSTLDTEQPPGAPRPTGRGALLPWPTGRGEQQLNAEHVRAAVAGMRALRERPARGAERTTVRFASRRCVILDGDRYAEADPLGWTGLDRPWAAVEPAAPLTAALLGMAEGEPCWTVEQRRWAKGGALRQLYVARVPHGLLLGAPWAAGPPVGLELYEALRETVGGELRFAERVTARDASVTEHLTLEARSLLVVTRVVRDEEDVPLALEEEIMPGGGVELLYSLPQPVDLAYQVPEC